MCGNENFIATPISLSKAEKCNIVMNQKKHRGATRINVQACINHKSIKSKCFPWVQLILNQTNFGFQLKSHFFFHWSTQQIYFSRNNRERNTTRQFCHQHMIEIATDDNVICFEVGKEISMHPCLNLTRLRRLGFQIVISEGI